MADPGYSFGGEYPPGHGIGAYPYPLDPHDEPYDVVHSYDNGLGPMSPGSMEPNVTTGLPLGPVDPDNEPTDAPEVPGPYAPVADEEEQ